MLAIKREIKTATLHRVAIAHMKAAKFAAENNWKT